MRGLIVRVRVVPRRTVVGDTDRGFDNLSESHHQSHVETIVLEGDMNNVISVKLTLDSTTGEKTDYDAFCL